MLSSVLSLFVFFAPLKQDTLINDSLKLAYYDYMLEGPNPGNTFIPFKMTDSSGKTWDEMINWGDIKLRFYPVVGNNHKSFKILVSSILQSKNPLVSKDGFGNMGFVIREDYAQLIREIPFDIVSEIYFDKRGILKPEYRYITPEIMQYLFNHEIKFFQSPNLSVYIEFEFWKKIREEKSAAAQHHK